MGSYIINVETPAGVSGSVVPDIGYHYTEFLNEINEAILKFSGTGSVKRALLVPGSKVEIKRNGTREFYGQIESIDTLDSGGIVAYVSGYEIWLAKENGTYSNSPYQSTASATINSEIIGESSYFTAGTIEAGTDIDFRVNRGESLWNGTSNLRRKTTQDIGIDYVNFEIDILDHKGSSTSVATFNDGLTMRNVRVSKSYPKGNKIRVYGKGDGDQQITATSQDATSISTYGPITRDVTDKSLISTAEAQKLADAERDLTKDETEIYDFDVINPNQGIVSGDVITLNSTDKGLNNEEVRIVAIIRGMRGSSEFLQLQVSNKSYSQLLKRKNKVLAQIEKQNRDLNTYMQGSTNVSEWSATQNANNTTSTEIRCPIKADMIQDEAGNLKFESFTLDYNITEFNKQYGGASFTGSDPQVQNTSGSTAPDVSGSSSSVAPDVLNDSGSTAPDVSGSSSSVAPDVQNDSGTTAYGSVVGTDSATGTTCNSGTWTTLCSVSTAGSNKSLYCDFYIKGSSGGDEDIQVKVYNSGAITATSSEFGIYQDGFRDDSHVKFRAIGAGTDGSSDSVSLMVYPFTGAIVLDGYLAVYYSSHEHSDGTYSAASHPHGDGTYAAANHSHDDGTYSAASHPHGDGTYAAANHPHSDGSYDINAADIDHISITDNVDTAASVNASNVVIYLDYYNTGTSTWDNKHSITPSPASLFGTDIDITDSGTYPDAVGSWRTRIVTNNANADLVHSTVKLKYPVDST